MKSFLQTRQLFDLELISDFTYLISFDEVGWGCVAGEVILGAVVITKEKLQNLGEEKWHHQVRDSKKISEKIRSEITSLNNILSYVGTGKISTINENGLVSAYEEALNDIISQIPEDIKKKALFLLDGSRVPETLKKYDYKIVVKGDDLSWSIGLASIIAKTYRDRLLSKYHDQYPLYGFNAHKGYGTPFHKEALIKEGLSPIHRIKASRKLLE